MANDLSSFDSSVLLVRELTGKYRPAGADEVLQAAQRLLGDTLSGRDVMHSPQHVRDYLRVKLGTLEHEVFAVLMMDSQNCVIEYLELFRGSVSSTSVYPREVVKECLARNAAAVVLVHNHPSGNSDPSRADERITQTLKAALDLVDVKVVDHMVVTRTHVLSLAERGLM